MKLGIFGDSYADVNGDNNLRSWPNLLKPYHIEGRCGISHWYTYQKFLEAVSHKNFSHIIFCHTNPHRWPCLPEELEGSNWNIHSHHNNSYQNELEYLNKYYFDLFPNTLVNYISEKIFTDVNEYCLKNNIYLVNVVCFNQKMFEYKTNFPILRNLDRVSNNEKIKVNNIAYSFFEICQKFNLKDGDPRICHLGNLNNKRFSDILYHLLLNNILNVDSELYKDFEWDTYDPSNDELFKKILES